MSLTALEARLTELLVEAGLARDDFATVLGEVCVALRSGGVPVARVGMGSDLLHPIIEARGYRWHLGGEVEREDFVRGGQDWTNPDWVNSPFYRLRERGETELRRRLGGEHKSGEFPLLDRLHREAHTDYVAFAIPFGAAMRLGEQLGVMASVSADRPGGFSDDELAMLRRLMRALAMTFKAIDAVNTTRVITETYLGVDPARRVLNGEILRGRGEAVDAILWYSDLEGFTRIADTAPRDDLLSFLNDYADVVVTAIRAHQGEVLKFIGDGILAKFPRDDTGGSCRDALDAATATLAGVARLNQSRGLAGQPVAGIHLALHIGEVLYGNIGSADRLDFTVVGPAVNEVARIEALCRSLDQPVLVSSAFARSAGDAAGRLVSLGRFALRGVRRPEELFTLDPEGVAAAA